MKKIKQITKFLVTIFLIVFNLLILAPEMQAGSFLDLSNQEGFADNEISTEYGQSGRRPTDIRIIIVRIVQVVLSLLAVIFVIMLILAGFKYMTAQGNDQQVDDAKKQIANGLIGLLIVFSSLGITLFVLNSLRKAARGLTY